MEAQPADKLDISSSPWFRSDSYTVQQLCFLNPAAMHVNSRVLYLGNIPRRIESPNTGCTTNTTASHPERLDQQTLIAQEDIDSNCDVERSQSSRHLALDSKLDSSQCDSSTCPPSLSTSWLSARDYFSQDEAAESPSAGDERNSRLGLISAAGSGSQDSCGPSQSSIPNYRTAPASMKSTEGAVPAEPISTTQAKGANVVSYAEPSTVMDRSNAEKYSAGTISNPLSGQLLASVGNSVNSEESVNSNWQKHGPAILQSQMLVQIRLFTCQMPLGTLTEDSEHPSRTDSRWKEYLVSARTTSDKEILNITMLVMTYGERIMRKTSARRRGFKLRINRDWRLNFYSTLDLTLALWNSKRRYLYILQLQDMDTRFSWIRLLAQYVYMPVSRSPVTVNFADEGLQIRFPEEWVHSRHRSPHHISLDLLKGQAASTGERQQAILNFVLVKKRLDDNEPQIADGSTSKYVLAWRKRQVQSLMSIDTVATSRILWMLPRHMEQALTIRSLFSEDFTLDIISPVSQASVNIDTHVLTGDPDSGKVTEKVEPPPVEGFCHLVNSRYLKAGFASSRGHQVYVHTHDHLVFLSMPREASPPTLNSEGDDDNLAHVTEVSPYALNKEGIFSWLGKCRSVTDVNWYDSVAASERDRRSSLISSAGGIVDLTATKSISPHGDKGFHLELEDGKKITFGVSTEELRNFWIRNLICLASWWRNRREVDALKRRAGQMDFLITPLLKNRSILISGYLYYKPHKFTSLRSCYCILTSDSMMLYRVSSRSPPKHRRLRGSGITMGYSFSLYDSFSLIGSYVYSGILTEDLLIGHDSHVDPSKPGVRSLPRAYEDGWVSQDTEQERCFVLWRSMPWKVLRRFKTSTGRPEVFLARTRVDRDLWVSALRFAVGPQFLESQLSHD